MTVVSDGQNTTWNGTTIAAAFAAPSGSGTASRSNSDPSGTNLLGDPVLVQDLTKLVADLGALPTDPRASVEAAMKQLFADVQVFLSQAATDAGKPDQIRTDVQTLVSNVRRDVGELAALDGTESSISFSGSLNRIAGIPSGGTSNGAAGVSIETGYDQLLGSIQQFGSSGSNPPSRTPLQSLLASSVVAPDSLTGVSEPVLARDILQLTQLLATEFKSIGAPLSNSIQILANDAAQLLAQPHHV